MMLLKDVHNAKIINIENKMSDITNLATTTAFHARINGLKVPYLVLSWQILVLKTSPSNVPKTSLKDPIWPSQVCPDLTPWGHPNLTSSDILKRRPEDVLVWHSSDVPGRLIRDVTRTFSGRPLEDLQITQTWMFQHFL